jgi:hypothetical protein
MKVYIAGPMTNLPDLNFPAFHAMAARLRAAGHEVKNPAEINPDPTAKWHDCMRADIRELVTCDAIAMLPGWKESIWQWQPPRRQQPAVLGLAPAAAAPDSGR